MTATPLVFLDTETDGLRPKRRPWEIAMIRRDAIGQREIEFMVQLKSLRGAELMGLKVGRYYERHPEGRKDAGQAPRFGGGSGFESPYSRSAAAARVASWTHGAHLVGAVPSFDAEVLARLLRKNGLLPTWHYHLIDVEALAVGWLAARGGAIAPPWKSEDLSRACGVEPANDEERHTAMGDARWAMRLYDAVMGEIDA